MRILFFSRTFGHTTFISRQVAEVAKVHEVLYLYITKSQLYQVPMVPAQQAPFYYPRLVLKVVNKFEKMGLLFYRRNYRFRQVLRQAILDFKPDVIHCQFGYEALILTENMGSMNIPVLVHFRGYDASKMLRLPVYVKKLGQLLLKPHVHAVFVCNHLKLNLQQAGIQVPRGRTIYSNTDVQFFKRSTKAPDRQRKVLLQVSTLRDKKGHEFTLQALRLLIDQYGRKDVHLVMTAFDDQHPRSLYLKNMVADLGLTDHVQLLGHVNPSEVKALLETANAFLLHSIKTRENDEEGIPNAIMEAMAMELPVVSTRHSGIPELVEDGVNGLLVEEKDVAAYAAAINDILEWPLLPHNRQKIMAQFSKESHMKHLLECYTEIHTATSKKMAVSR